MSNKFFYFYLAHRMKKQNIRSGWTKTKKRQADNYWDNFLTTMPPFSFEYPNYDQFIQQLAINPANISDRPFNHYGILYFSTPEGLAICTAAYVGHIHVLLT